MANCFLFTVNKAAALGEWWIQTITYHANGLTLKRLRKSFPTLFGRIALSFEPSLLTLQDGLSISLVRGTPRLLGKQEISKLAIPNTGPHNDEKDEGIDRPKDFGVKRVVTGRRRRRIDTVVVFLQVPTQKGQRVLNKIRIHGGTQLNKDIKGGDLIQGTLSRTIERVFVNKIDVCKLDTTNEMQPSFSIRNCARHYLVSSAPWNNDEGDSQLAGACLRVDHCGRIQETQSLLSCKMYKGPADNRTLICSHSNYYCKVSWRSLGST